MTCPRRHGRGELRWGCQGSVFRAVRWQKGPSLLSQQNTTFGTVLKAASGCKSNPIVCHNSHLAPLRGDVWLCSFGAAVVSAPIDGNPYYFTVSQDLLGNHGLGHRYAWDSPGQVLSKTSIRTRFKAF